METIIIGALDYDPVNPNTIQYHTRNPYKEALYELFEAVSLEENHHSKNFKVIHLGGFINPDLHPRVNYENTNMIFGLTAGRLHLTNWIQHFSPIEFEYMLKFNDIKPQNDDDYFNQHTANLLNFMWTNDLISVATGIYTADGMKDGIASSSGISFELYNEATASMHDPKLEDIVKRLNKNKRDYILSSLDKTLGSWLHKPQRFNQWVKGYPQIDGSNPMLEYMGVSKHGLLLPEDLTNYEFDDINKGIKSIQMLTSSPELIYNINTVD